ncbi:hypothetical protein CR513_49018, partial [Mucuna pruriens]
MKSGYWEIQIKETDRYKTVFTIPFGQYEWNVIAFDLKNAPSEFQKIMNDILNPYSKFTIVYIDDVLIFSQTIDQHFRHLHIFNNIVKQNGLAVSQIKINLFQTKIRFFGHNIHQGTIIPIEREKEGPNKFHKRRNKPQITEKIQSLLKYIRTTIYSNLPHAFWNRKKHMVDLPYEKNFTKKQIPTKARPIQMNEEMLQYCQKEIKDLLDKGLIRKSKSPWLCAAFYRGSPRLVINYKPLNQVLQWIRYPIPNKKDLLNRLNSAKIFLKFDMKSGYWEIQIKETDRYKTVFTIPFGQYEWNVIAFDLKNAPSEFQKIMNDILNPYSKFTIVYIDD